MSRTRRTFGKDFKAKVVLEALKRRYHRGIKKKVRAVAQSNFNVGPKRYGIFLQFSAEKTVVTNEIPTENSIESVS
jgi:hypothetical protein